MCVVKKEVGLLLAVQPQEVGSLPLNRAAGTFRIKMGQKNKMGGARGGAYTYYPLSPCVPLS